MIQGAQIGVPPCNGVGCVQTSNCIDEFGCPPNRCPDFLIKRHDVRPPFTMSVSDCDGPMDLSDPNMVVEVNMWAKAKFKKNVASTDVLFAVADGIGFEQMMPGDIVVVDRVRNPEHMLITGFDETNQLVLVQRAYHGTIASDYVRGTAIRVFRILNGGASIGLSYQDLTQEDGSVLEHQLVTTTLNYDWQPNDTCLPGCFWLEFKLLQMTPIFGISTISVVDVPSIIDVPSIVNVPSVISVVPCGIGLDVEWVRRFPVEGEGFLIKIMDSPTSEM